MGPGPHAVNPGGPGTYPGASGGPQPWGGGQPWGVPEPYGFGPPPTKKPNGALIAVLAGAGVLFVLLAVIGVVAVGRSGDDPQRTSGKAANQAAQTIGQAAGLTLTGPYAGIRATFSVTKAGSARGTYTADGSPISRVDIDGATYIKASVSFWTDQGLSAERAKKAGGGWTKAPDDVGALNLAELSPERLASVLRQAGNDPLAVRTTVNGVEAIKMRVGLRTYYISKSEPRRVIRLEGMAGTDRYTFDVTPLTSSTIGPVFSGLRTDVHALAGAYDPDLTVTPISKVQFGNCVESGCTVRADVRATTVSDSTGAVRVTMKVAFSGSGGTVSTCTDTASTKADRQVGLSCRTSGGAWSSWYRSHVGRFTIHAKAAFDATVNSSADVNGLLSKLAEEQRTG
jgi:hypothetical protein